MKTADCVRLVGRFKLSMKNNHKLSTFFIITRLLLWILLYYFLRNEYWKELRKKTTVDTVKQTTESEAGLAGV